jgi:hypothetical protein
MFDQSTHFIQHSTNPKNPRDSQNADSVLAHMTVAELTARMTQTDKLNGFANRFGFLNVSQAHHRPDGIAENVLATNASAKVETTDAD